MAKRIRRDARKKTGGKALLSQVPAELRGASEEKMHNYVKRLSDPQILRIINSHPKLGKTADGETLTQVAFGEKLLRRSQTKRKS